MARPKKYPDELMDRGVRLVFESGRPIAHVARDLGVPAEALRKRVRRAEVDAGKREGLTTDEREGRRTARPSAAMTAIGSPGTRSPGVGPSRGSRCVERSGQFPVRRDSREADGTHDEGALATEHVAEASAERQQAAEGKRIAGDDPLTLAVREMQRALCRGQSDVHDRRVEHDHQLCEHDETKNEPATQIALRADLAKSRRTRKGGNACRRRQIGEMTCIETLHPAVPS